MLGQDDVKTVRRSEAAAERAAYSRRRAAEADARAEGEPDLEMAKMHRAEAAFHRRAAESQDHTAQALRVLEG